MDILDAVRTNLLSPALLFFRAGGAGRQRLLHRRPAAIRQSLPEANPALYLTSSLAITFPFNLTRGIPFCHAMKLVPIVCEAYAQAAVTGLLCEVGAAGRGTSRSLPTSRSRSSCAPNWWPPFSNAWSASCFPATA